VVVASAASTPSLIFLQAKCSSCHPINSVEALKAKFTMQSNKTLINNCCLTAFCKQKLYNYMLLKIQCFDVVGWAAGRASGL